MHVLETFHSARQIDQIYLVVSAEDAYIDELPLPPRCTVLRCGGATRQASVTNGLLAMRSETEDDDWILVHDAARPGLTAALLDQLLDTLEHDAVGGLLALPLADTLKQSNTDSRVEKTIPREGLWQAQTPQMFRFALLHKALTSFKGSPTDEAQAVEALGLQPKLVVGSMRNMKITYPQDMALMEILIQKEIA